MRTAAVLSMLVVVGCERDPAPTPAPKLAEDVEPPGAVRPEVPARKPAEVAPGAPGELDCFEPWRTFSVEEWAGHVATADVNEDGRLDVLAVVMVHERDQFTEHLVTLLGDGRGGFARAAGMVPLGDMVVELAVADYDGDGHVDIAAQSAREKQLVILRGDGTGELTFARHVKTSRKPTGVEAADVDADGDADLVASFHEFVQVFLNDGRGAFRGEAPMKQGRAVDGPVAFDGDGDGDVDLYFVNNDDYTYAWLAGDGTGRFEPAAVAEHTGACGSPSFTTAADFDGDGALDVAYACIVDHGGIQIRPSGRGAPIDVATGAVEAFAAADFTGDGVVDLVTMGREGSWSDAEVRLHQGKGDGSFRTRDTTAVPGSLMSAVAADVNADGKPDVVASYWSGREPGYVGVWLGRRCGR
jgi:hypothetical protein